MDRLDLQLETIVSVLLGGSLASVLAKAYISRSLKDLEEVSKKVADINTSLSAIAVKLGHADKDHDLLLLHDRKIAAMENEIYGHRTARKNIAAGER